MLMYCSLFKSMPTTLPKNCLSKAPYVSINTATIPCFCALASIWAAMRDFPDPSRPLSYIILPDGTPPFGLFDIIKSSTLLPVDIQFFILVGSIIEFPLTSYDIWPNVFENYLFRALLSIEFKSYLSIEKSCFPLSYNIYFFTIFLPHKKQQGFPPAYCYLSCLAQAWHLFLPLLHQ